jgi:nitrite reductase (NADH) small subunit
LFRTFDGMLYAIGNQDPFSGAFVLSRGIVRSRREAPTVASPLFKPAFDLRAGGCVTDASTAVEVDEVLRNGAAVEVRTQPGSSP